MKLFLLRHGETDWNREGRMQGWSDVPMNKTGKKQAAERAELLAGEKIDAVYSSDLQRAAKTAEAIAERHGLEVVETKALRESWIGELEGMKHGESIAAHPDYYVEREKGNNKFTMQYPGGESHEMLFKRVKKFIEKIKKKHNKETLIVVSHNGTQRALIGGLLGMKPEEFMKIESPNNSIWEIDSEKKEAVMKVEGKEVQRFQNKTKS